MNDISSDARDQHGDSDAPFLDEARERLAAHKGLRHLLSADQLAALSRLMQQLKFRDMTEADGARSDRDPQTEIFFIT